MGWTSYHATHYKNGKIDRKAECDAYWLEGLNRGHFEVLKSRMVGTVYYAAVKPLKRRVASDDRWFDEYVDIPKEEQYVFAAITLTSVDSKSYYNFSYKDMDETCGPCYNDCPKSILDLLTPTNSELAKQWRQACYDNTKAKKNPNSLNKLPIGTVIQVTMPVETLYYKIGNVVTLTKQRRLTSGRPAWYSPRARFSSTLMKMLDGHYEVIKKGE